MKNNIFTLILVLFVACGFSQEMGYDIYDTYSKPVLSEQLNEARAMVDINPDYPSSWIAESDYISSEIKVICEGDVVATKGKNHLLSEAQKNALKKADSGTSIDVEIKYNAKNSITNLIDVKTMNFSVSLIPEKEAEYIGGQEKMKAYLKENAVDKINESANNNFELAKVRFIVDESGKTINAEISKSSEDEIIDQLILEAISNMPNWMPAESSDGRKVRQEFEFIVGTIIGC